MYPDDDNKPLVGEGFNKKAQVTLDSVWPIDKSAHTPIKVSGFLTSLSYLYFSPEYGHFQEMNYHDKNARMPILRME